MWRKSLRICLLNLKSVIVLIVKTVTELLHFFISIHEVLQSIVGYQLIEVTECSIGVLMEYIHDFHQQLDTTNFQ